MTSSPVTGAPATTAPGPPEVIEVESQVVDCDGGGALGHPRVWLNVAGKGEIDCPYCDRRFVLKTNSGETTGR